MNPLWYVPIITAGLALIIGLIAFFLNPKKSTPAPITATPATVPAPVKRDWKWWQGAMTILLLGGVAILLSIWIVSAILGLSLLMRYPKSFTMETTTTASTEQTVRREVYTISPTAWTEIRLQPRVRNELIYSGLARFADRNGRVLYEGPYTPDMMNNVIASRLWVQSLDWEKPLTQETPS